MMDLYQYLSETSKTSKFPCDIGDTGGYVNFRNSGQRGSVKEFTLSLSTMISGLKDIRTNLDNFSNMSTYVEQNWRDSGTAFFTDLSLKSMITVQTKPCFTTFSKIINWANSINEYDDNKILLTEVALDTAIKKLEVLSLSYTPKERSSSVPNKEFNWTSKGVLSKPFLLLAGISGTGKTRFVREQAKHSGSLEETYCLVSVRPDWHEPSDLLGYTSRLSGNEYVVTDVLRFLVKAWLEVLASGASLGETSLQGNQAQVKTIRPFWLCLDEMNLAPVEQYFADYLSILETRKWSWEDGSFSYSCDPILKPDVISGLSNEGKLKLRNDLGLAENEDLWQHFITYGISIPLNLIVAGTVNMDETTHGFSRKVIDRALSFDFGEFFPNNYSEFFISKTDIKPLSFPIYSQCDSADMLADSYDEDGKETIAFLESVNNVLNNTSFKLAYRALNEILLSVAVHQPKDELSLQAVWDDFLMCKVLPRIEGDIDKLTQQDNQSNILTDLEDVLAKQLKGIWGSETRPDLYRSNIDKDNPLTIPCRSEAKLKWMNSRLSIGFTSFWP